MTQYPGEQPPTPEPAEPSAPTGSADPEAGGEASAAPWWRGRRGIAAGAGVLAVVVVAGAAWAVTAKLSGGDPAESALPDTALGSLSLDLDPGAGQKVEALKTLRKFPDLREQLGLGSGGGDGDLREKLVTKALEEGDCNLTWDKDVRPWLGSNAAIAAVPAGGDRVAPVVAVAVTDESKARTGLAEIARCDQSDDPTAFDVADGFAVISDTKAHVRSAMARAKDHPLTDDATYQKWTDKAGDRGVLNAYVAPAAAKYLEDSAPGLLGGLTGPDVGDIADEDPALGDGELTPAAYQPAASGSEVVKDFEGGAASFRFADSGVELSAVFGGLGKNVDGASAEEIAGALPKDTAAALAFGVPKGLAKSLSPAFEALTAFTGLSADELGESVGLDLPDDLETLLGDGVGLAVQDTDDVTSVSDPSDLPIGLLIHGDLSEIKGVVDKVQDKTGLSLADLGVSLADRGDLISAAFDDSWAKALVSGGGLEDEESFRSVVPDVDRDASFAYVDFDAELRKAIARADGGSDGRRFLADTEPLQAAGLSTWAEKSDSHLLLKVTTD